MIIDIYNIELNFFTKHWLIFIKSLTLTKSCYPVLKIWSRFPVIFLSVCLMLGIASYNLWPISIQYSIPVFIGSIGGLSILHIYQNKRIKKLKIIPVLLALTTGILGQILSGIHQPENQLQHFQHYIKPNNALVLNILKEIKPTGSYHNFYAGVQQINQHRATGKMLLKIPNNEKKPHIGETIQLLADKNHIQKIPKPLNPFGFNYRNFLKHHGIYHQINLKNAGYKILPNGHKNWLYRISKFKTQIKNRLKKHLSPKTFGLETALLLGERQALSPDIYQNFQATGTVHILAISGLHIGILLLFLNFLFKPVKRYSTVLFLITTIGILWFYALLTGFSPSVLRAVIMFSFLQIGMQSKRQTNVYNSLFLAALVMLLINPEYLYQVGFQMSFAAVLAIVSFYPVFEKYFPVQQRILKYFTDLLWVSLSAQLGVLPLSLYYFHQFPTYFLLANSLSIPLLFLILFSGFSLIILGLIHLDFNILYQFFDALLSFLLSINQQIALLPYSLIQNIRFSNLLLIVSFTGLIVLYYFLSKPKVYRHWLWLGSWIILFEIVIWVQNQNDLQKENFYVFHQYKTPVVAMAKSGNMQIFQDKNLIDKYLQKSLKLHFNHLQYDSLPFFQTFNKYQILHLDSLGIYRFKNFQPDIVVLHYSPKINMDRLIQNLQPKIIVADGSNYKSYIRRWQQSAKKYRIPFYDVNQKGAFILPGRLSSTLKCDKND